MTQDMHYIYRVALLIGKMRVGMLSPAEEHELDQWREESPENQQLFERWVEGDFLQENYLVFNGVDGDRALRDMQERIYRESRSVAGTRRRPWRYAAVAAVMVGIVVGARFFVHERVVEPRHVAVLETLVPQSPVLSFTDGRLIDLDSSTLFLRGGEMLIRRVDGSESVIAAEELPGSVELVLATLEVPKGRTYEVWLDDGTHVRLNADSKLTYPVTFPRDRREVTLTGEACFEVTKEPGRPFTVRANATEVAVLGTVFNVEAYDAGATTTTLLSGSVQVAHGAESVVITPGQMAVTSFVGPEIRVQKANLETVFAWTKNNFYFHELPLEKIMERLSRWYECDILFENDALRHRRLSIEISRDVPVMKIITIIEEIVATKFDIKERTIIVK